MRAGETGIVIVQAYSYNGPHIGGRLAAPTMDAKMPELHDVECRMFPSWNTLPIDLIKNPRVTRHIPARRMHLRLKEARTHSERITHEELLMTHEEPLMTHSANHADYPSHPF